MNTIKLDASHITLGQSNTVAIVWISRKKCSTCFLQRFLSYICTQPLFQVAHGQSEANPWFWLITRADKIGPSCPLGIARLTKPVNFRQCWWWSCKKWQTVIKTKEVKTAVVCLLCRKHIWLPFPPLEINELFLILSTIKVIAKKNVGPFEYEWLDRFWIFFCISMGGNKQTYHCKSTHLLCYLFL